MRFVKFEIEIIKGDLFVIIFDWEDFMENIFYFLIFVFFGFDFFLEEGCIVVCLNIG